MKLLSCILVLAFVALLSGCATMFGNASYSYRNGDCEADIDSRRDVSGPVEFEMDKDCNLKVKTGDLKGGNVSEATLNRVIDLGERVVAPGALPTPDGG